jgi:hypothetical protein
VQVVAGGDQVGPSKLCRLILPPNHPHTTRTLTHSTQTLGTNRHQQAVLPEAGQHDTAPCIKVSWQQLGATHMAITM